MSTIRTITDPETGISGEVDRYLQNIPDGYIVCQLECGYSQRFFIFDKPDLYYLKTTIYFKENNL